MCFRSLQYSVIHKQLQAHDDGIWSVAWARGDKGTRNRIITGSVDDTVKAWTW